MSVFAVTAPHTVSTVIADSVCVFLFYAVARKLHVALATPELL